MPFVKEHAKLLIAILAVLALGLAAMKMFVLDPPKAQEETAPADTRFTLAPEAEKWDGGTSTPLIVHVSGNRDDGSSISYYTAIPAEGEREFDLEPGRYELDWITPVNADGSIYSTPSAKTVEGTVEEPIAVELGLHKADEVTPAQADKIVSSIAEARSFGDESMSGNKGKAILGKAKANIRKAPQVAESTAAEEAAKEAEEAAREEAKAQEEAEKKAAAEAEKKAASEASDAKKKAEESALRDAAARAAADRATSTGGNTNVKTSEQQAAGSSAAGTAPGGTGTGTTGTGITATTAKKWIETTTRKGTKPEPRWVDRGDGTGYFETVEAEDTEIDKPGHWE